MSRAFHVIIPRTTTLDGEVYVSVPLQAMVELVRNIKQLVITGKYRKSYLDLSANKFQRQIYTVLFTIKHNKVHMAKVTLGVTRVRL